MPDCDKKDMDDRFSYTTFVRGKTILFDRDTINTYLGEPLTLPPSEDPTVPTLCEYGRNEEDNEWDHGMIVRDILLPGKRYKKGKGEESTTVSYADMTLKAAFIFKFLVHNVWPKSHVSTTPKAVTPLIWHICKGGEVDVSRIISRELKHVALRLMLPPQNVYNVCFVLFFTKIIIILLFYTISLGKKITWINEKNKKKIRTQKKVLMCLLIKQTQEKKEKKRIKRKKTLILGGSWTLESWEDQHKLQPLEHICKHEIFKR